MSALLGRWAPCSNCRLCRFFSLSLFSDATAAAANDDFHMPSHRPYFFDWKTRRNQLMVYTRTPSYILQTEVERSRRTNEYKGYIFFFASSFWRNEEHTFANLHTCSVRVRMKNVLVRRSSSIHEKFWDAPHRFVSRSNTSCNLIYLFLKDFFSPFILTVRFSCASTFVLRHQK